MRVMLRTPGLQRLVGRSTALITFTGRKTGVPYTTPITYTRRDDKVILTGHESRQWWRNLSAQPQVQLRLAGSSRTGAARVLHGGEALPYFIDFLADQRMVAKASGVGFDEEGRPDTLQAKEALGDTVVVVVALEPQRVMLGP